MLIPPKYVLTAKISGFLASIESSKDVINAIDIPDEVEINTRRQATLKSSLFSARIEGNSNQEKVEVFNIQKALNYIFSRQSMDLSEDDLLKLHQIVMDGLTEDPGRFRIESIAIFKPIDTAIYLPPTPKNIPPLILKLINFINSSEERFVPIRAILAHFVFEKIHPFLDGNGKVGRVLLQMVLNNGGYGMKGLISIEEYLDNHMAEYYKGLQDPESDATGYVEFMLESIAASALDAKDKVLDKRDLVFSDFLLPRRGEILNIIKDHKILNFDQIRRRFMGVNERTLRYDLKKLQDSGLIRKRGITKGVYYEIS